MIIYNVTYYCTVIEYTLLCLYYHGMYPLLTHTYVIDISINNLYTNGTMAAVYLFLHHVLIRNHPVYNTVQ